MKQPNISTGSAIRILKALLSSYIVTGLLLLAIAGLMYRFHLNEGKIQIGIIVTYIFSCFCGGFLTGKMMKNRKFLWGVLMGFLYFAVLMLVSLAVNRELQLTATEFITSFLLCMGGGMLGGMCA